MLKLQVKEIDKKDKCTSMIQVCASAYALFMILLYCIVSIIMVGIYILTVSIPILKGAMWLLKATRFEKICFQTLN